MKFDVSSYYGTNLNGLEDRKTDLTFDEARDFLHEKVSNGGVVEIACTTTGVRKIFTYDEYFDGFEGESPMMLSDFEQTYPVADISPDNRAFLSDSINEFVGKENKMQTFSKDKTAINKNKGEVKE